MHNVMSAQCGCHIQVNSTPVITLRSSVHTVLVISLRSVGLNFKQKYIIYVSVYSSHSPTLQTLHLFIHPPSIHPSIHPLIHGLTAYWCPMSPHFLTR